MYYLYFCYFTFGWSLSFSSVATQFIMMDLLDMTPAEMSLSIAIISFPWCLKPTYGFISDNYHVFNLGRRRPYIAYGGYMTAFLYVFMKEAIKSKYSLVVVLTLISLHICIADVCADSILVEYSNKMKSKGSIQTNCWASRAFGTFIGCLFGGMAYAKLGAVTVYIFTASVPLCMSLIVWNMPKFENRKKDKNVLQNILNNLKKQKNLLILLLFVQIAPNYGEFYTYFLRKELDYTPYDFSWLAVSGSLAWLSSTLFYNRYLLHVSKLRIILVGIGVTFLLRLTQLVVVSKISTQFWLVLFDGLAENFFANLVGMVIFIQATKSCDKGVEGVMYALMMSTANLSNVIATFLGSYIGKRFDITEHNFDNLGIFMFLCIILDTVISLYVILKNFSFSLDSTDSDSEEEVLTQEEMEFLDHTLEPVDPEDPENKPGSLGNTNPRWVNVKVREALKGLSVSSTGSLEKLEYKQDSSDYEGCRQDSLDYKSDSSGDTRGFSDALEVDLGRRSDSSGEHL